MFEQIVTILLDLYMTIHMKIILRFVVLSFLFACEKHSPAPPSSVALSGKTVESVFDYLKVCQLYKTQIDELCGQKDGKGRCILKNDESILKALNILKSLPDISHDVYQKYEKFFSNKNYKKNDISEYFALVASDCWKDSELKLWKALSLSYKSQSRYNYEIRTSFNEAIHRVQKTPLSVVRLMINFVIAENWADSGLLMMKNDNLANLKKIKSEVKVKTKEISKRYESVFKFFIYEQEGKVPQNEHLDLTNAYKLLVKEQILIKDYSKKLNRWMGVSL